MRIVAVPDEAPRLFWVDGSSTAPESHSTHSSATVQVPQDPPPQVRVPQRSDLGTYSHESLRKLSDEERLWLKLTRSKYYRT